jgi:2,5-dioxopentanoate dehydrogenase
MDNTTLEQLRKQCDLAQSTVPILRKLSHEKRAALLEGIADRLASHRAEIVPLAMQESNLPEARLNGELDRTCFQFRNFAQVVRSGEFARTAVTDALPDRAPLPRPKLELIHVPVGVVAVFGASNFPLAFSVSGGDTASAIAAGCPVIVMAHPAHPKLSKLVSDLISQEVDAHDLPSGTFSCVFGGPEIGRTLVEDSSVQAVGFTGSQRVGRILMDLAGQRPNPIPVFAEMGSINPTYLSPGALATRAAALSSGYAASLTMGVGQFCTNPGVVVGVKSEGWNAFKEALIAELSGNTGGLMLTDMIGENYVRSALVISAEAEVLLEVQGAGKPGLAKVSAREFRENHLLQEEVFGPFGLLVECETVEEMLATVPSQGQLTGTIHCEIGEEVFVSEMVTNLEPKVGRLVFNGFPTGVEVCAAMHHGGPYPAASDARFTSVGDGAIKRWLRPVSYQNAPAFLKLG